MTLVGMCVIEYYFHTTLFVIDIYLEAPITICFCVESSTEGFLIIGI